MEKYLKATPLLDFEHPRIKELIHQKDWNRLDEVEKVKQIYNFGLLLILMLLLF